MACSPFGRVSIRSPWGANARRISATVAAAGSMHKRIRSAIGPPRVGHPTTPKGILDRAGPLPGGPSAGGLSGHLQGAHQIDHATWVTHEEHLPDVLRHAPARGLPHREEQRVARTEPAELPVDLDELLPLQDADDLVLVVSPDEAAGGAVTLAGEQRAVGRLKGAGAAGTRRPFGDVEGLLFQRGGRTGEDPLARAVRLQDELRAPLFQTSAEHGGKT